MGYVVTTETATVYKVRYQKEGDEPYHFGWADAAVRTFPRGGAISIQSDYGTYAYTWTAIGDGQFIKFLCLLDFDYFMKKTCGDYYVFDHDKSMDGIKRQIIERRRDKLFHEMTKEQAREAWDDLERYGANATNSGDMFVSDILSSRALADFFDGGDYYTNIASYKPNPQAVGFWNEIWPHLVAAWQVEMAQAA